MENNLIEIKEFINQWKEKAIKVHSTNFDLYIKEKSQTGRTREEYKKWVHHCQEDYGQLVIDCACWGKEKGKAKLIKLIEKEAEAKEKQLVSRINKKGGIIKRALDLYIGVNGELNGRIECQDKVVNVETIYAGGYNIQCLHYRVLVK